MGFCDQCGTKVSATARFCAACGNPVGRDGAMPAPRTGGSYAGPSRAPVTWTPPGRLLEWGNQLVVGDRLRHTAITIAKVLGPTVVALVLVSLVVVSRIDTDDVAVNVAALGVKVGLLALPVLFGGMFTAKLEFSSVFLAGDGTGSVGGAVALVPLLVVGGIAMLLRRSPWCREEAPLVLAVRTGLVTGLAVTAIGVVGRHRFTIAEDTEIFRFVLSSGLGRAALLAFLLSAGAVLVAFADRLEWDRLEPRLPEALRGLRDVLEATAYSTVALLGVGTVGAVVTVLVVGADSAFEDFSSLLLLSLLYLPAIVVNFMGVGLGVTMTAEARGRGSWFAGLDLWPTESIGWFGDVGVAWWVVLLGVVLGGAALYAAGLRAANRFGYEAPGVLMRAAPLTALVWVLASRLATLSFTAEGALAEEFLGSGRQGLEMRMSLSVVGTFLLVGAWTFACTWLATRTSEQGTQLLADVPLLGPLVDVPGTSPVWNGPTAPPPAGAPPAGPPPSPAMPPAGPPPVGPPPAGPPAVPTSSPAMPPAPPTAPPAMPPPAWPPAPPASPPLAAGAAPTQEPLPGGFPAPQPPRATDDDRG